MQGAASSPRGWAGIAPLAAIALSLILPGSSSAAAVEELRFTSLEAKGETHSGFTYKLAADRFAGDFPKGIDDVAVSLTMRSGTRLQGTGVRFTTFYAPTRRGGQSFDRRHVSARLGERGSVGMRFRERSRRVRKLGKCGRSVVRRGVLVGHLRFRGEAGYVRIVNHRVPAIERSFRFRLCNPRDDHSSRHDPVLLLACHRSGSLFAARQFPRGRTDFFGFTPLRRHRGLFRGSFAVAGGEPDQFTFSDDLSSAAVAPSAPFRGAGSYRSDGGGGRFDGELRASFPATKRIRFAPGNATLARDEEAGCFGDSARGRSELARARGSMLRAAGIDPLR